MSYDPPKPTSGIVIYGYSDDLIEVDGEISDELQADDGVNLITASDGTIASVRFDHDGIWRIWIVVAGTGNPSVDVHPLTEDGPDGRYTDLLYIPGPVAWVRFADGPLAPHAPDCDNGATCGEAAHCPERGQA